MSVLGTQGAPVLDVAGRAIPVARVVAPSPPVVVVLRVLVAVGLVLGFVSLASRPVDRTLDELLEGIRTGTVTEVTMERWGEDVTGSGMLRIDWRQDGRPATATYDFSDLEGTPQVDEGAQVLDAAAKADVAVTTVSELGYPSGVVLPAGWWGLAAALAFLVLLVGGGEPRLATRWAWFWVVLALPPVALAFVVLEPLPVWAGRPRPAPDRRLTGGWAFLLAFVVAEPVLKALLGPEWSFLLG